MPTVFPSLHAVDQDSPHFSEMDIETLHNQLLEAAAALDDFAVRSSELVDMWARGFHSGRYIDIPGFDKRHPVIAPEGEADTICIPITLFCSSQILPSRCALTVGRTGKRSLTTAMWTSPL